ncbi:hypothetical protein [Nakamurella leprariae]|uniref:Uncharacterized protein n=1 Tax=Nakamurella leprariae TaxID=2803911 RepID=A0A938Y4V2_9ACTN|nr:hypothetical protein [Nakamurella leprariae]MBM9465780.1 hypothetical protein [Nakamurella leprariae]
MTGQLSVDTALLRRSSRSLRAAAQHWRAESPDPSAVMAPPVAASIGDTATAVEAISLLQRRMRSALATARWLGQIADHRADLLDRTASAFEATG